MEYTVCIVCSRCCVKIEYFLYFGIFGIYGSNDDSFCAKRKISVLQMLYLVRIVFESSI
jgi:hypothetical protein